MDFACSPLPARSRFYRFAIDKRAQLCYYICVKISKEQMTMKRIQTIKTRDLKESVKNGGCGECQTSCQSACKTSCGIANQPCEKADN